jgi:hypothetical protein
MNNICETTLILPQITINFLLDKLNNNKNNEIAGNFNIKKQNEKEYLLLKGDKIVQGTDDKVGKVISRYNWHTHPIGAYIKYKVKKGIPSNWDYIMFLTNYCDKNCNTIFHIVIALEGFYIISINKDLCGLKKIDKKLNKHIMNKFGIVEEDIDIDYYIKKVNNIKYKDKYIFNVEFRNYNNKYENNYRFNIYYPKNNNSCELE